MEPWRTGRVTSDWVSVDPIHAEVQPGDVLTLTVALHAPTGSSGTHRAILWMVSDDPYRPELRLSVEMNIPPKVYLPLLLNMQTP